MNKQPVKPASQPPVTPPVLPPSSAPSKVQRGMEKFFRLVKYFLLSSLILTIMEIGFAYWLISSRWSLLLDKEQMERFTADVQKAEPMPENYMKVYTTIYPKHVHTTLTQQIFVNYTTRFLFRHTDIDKKPHCFCDMVYDIQKKYTPELEKVDWDGRLQDLEYGFGVEKFTSPDKCFHYVTRFRIEEVRSHMDKRKWGHLLNKPIEEFTDDEILQIVAVMRARGDYSPNRTAERYEELLKEYRLRYFGPNYVNQ